MSTNKFIVGEKVNIEDLTEQDARIIFGNAIYEHWRKSKGNTKSGYVTVTGIDKNAGVITIDTNPHKTK